MIFEFVSRQAPESRSPVTFAPSRLRLNKLFIFIFLILKKWLAGKQRPWVTPSGFGIYRHARKKLEPFPFLFRENDNRTFPARQGFYGQTSFKIKFDTFPPKPC